MAGAEGAFGGVLSFSEAVKKPIPPVPRSASWLQPPRDWCDEFHDVDHGSSVSPG